MRRSLRLILATAIVGGSIFINVGPAAATCRPEDKVPCETEFPDPREWLQNCSTNFDPGLPTKLGVCDL